MAITKLAAVRRRYVNKQHGYDSTRLPIKSSDGKTLALLSLNGLLLWDKHLHDWSCISIDTLVSEYEALKKRLLPVEEEVV